MLTPSSRRGNLVTVTFLLLLSVLFEQYGIAPFFPWANAAGSFRPMIVFLDIPLSLPDIDWLPASLLFSIFYCVIVGRRPSATSLPKQLWKALSGWWILLAFIAAGGGLYMLVEAYLPIHIANGIDSFGVRADLTLPWPSGETLHLHGSMLMLLFALPGGYIMARRSSIPSTASAPSTPVTTAESAVAAARAIINSPARTSTKQLAPAGEPGQEPVFPGEPPTCRLTTPPPIAMVMPRPAPGIGKVYPCIVIGSVKPGRCIEPTRSAPASYTSVS